MRHQTNSLKNGLANAGGAVPAATGKVLLPRQDRRADATGDTRRPRFHMSWRRSGKDSGLTDE